MNVNRLKRWKWKELPYELRRGTQRACITTDIHGICTDCNFLICKTNGVVMTIQEAIKSGKKFGRKEWGVLSLKVSRNGFLIWSDTKDTVPMTKQDILANDWEAKK